MLIIAHIPDFCPRQTKVFSVFADTIYETINILYLCPLAEEMIAREGII